MFFLLIEDELFFVDEERPEISITGKTTPMAQLVCIISSLTLLRLEVKLITDTFFTFPKYEINRWGRKIIPKFVIMVIDQKNKP